MHIGQIGDASGFRPIHPRPQTDHGQTPAQKVNAGAKPADSVVLSTEAQRVSDLVDRLLRGAADRDALVAEVGARAASGLLDTEATYAATAARILQSPRD